MFLDLVAPEAIEDHGVKERMAAGRAYEAWVRGMLIRAGTVGRFELQQGQSRVEIRGRSGSVVISGKVDGIIEFARPRSRAIIEIKAGASVERCRTLDDLLAGTWTRHIPRQLAVYMLGMEINTGVLILAQHGQPRFIEMSLRDDGVLRMAEEFLARAEDVVNLVERRGGPPAFHGDPDECRRCPRIDSCMPPTLNPSSAQIATSEHLIMAANTWLETRVAAAAFARADRDLKEACRRLPQVIIGRCLVTGKPGRQSRLDLPPEIRRKYTVVDTAGRWLAKISPLGSPSGDQADDHE
jgi:hypothetical protein